jgi:hypothetical protein
MTSYASHKASVESLVRLPPLAPDPDRSERVRARCRTQLSRRRRRSARFAVICGVGWSVLAPAAVSGFCILYAVALVATILRLQGVF